VPVWTGAENLAPTATRPRTVHPLSSHYIDRTELSQPTLCDCIYVCICVMYVCICDVREYIYIYVCVYVCVYYVYMCAYVYVLCMYVCMYV
jgi:hypothetical protein